MKRTNEELCMLAQSGELWAVEELLRRNELLFRKIVSTVWKDFRISRIIGIGKDDLHQEALIKAYELIYKFNADKNIKFSTFIFQPIRNHLIDYIQSEDCEIYLEDYVREYAERSQFPSEIYVLSPEVLYLKKETYNALYAAMNSIPIRNCRYVEFRFGFDSDEERTKKETAKHFHLSLSRAGQLEKTSLKMIREKLI